jgi:hypothetical protein
MQWPKRDFSVSTVRAAGNALAFEAKLRELYGRRAHSGSALSLLSILFRSLRFHFLLLLRVFGPRWNYSYESRVSDRLGQRFGAVADDETESQIFRAAKRAAGQPESSLLDNSLQA